MAVPPNQLNNLGILVDDLENIVPSGFPPLKSVSEGAYEGFISLVRHEVSDGQRQPAWWLNLTSDEIRADSEKPARMMECVTRIRDSAKFAWDVRPYLDDGSVLHFEHLLSVVTCWELQVELQWTGEDDPPRGIWHLDPLFLLICDSVSGAAYFRSAVDV